MREVKLVSGRVVNMFDTVRGMKMRFGNDLYKKYGKPEGVLGMCMDLTLEDGCRSLYKGDIYIDKSARLLFFNKAKTEKEIDNLLDRINEGTL